MVKIVAIGFERQDIAEFLFDHIADHALGLWPEHVERGVLSLESDLLEEQQPTCGSFRE